MTDNSEGTISIEIESSEKDYQMLGSICRSGDPNVTDPELIPVLRNRIIHEWIFQKFISLLGNIYRCRCKRDADIPPDPEDTYFFCEENCDDDIPVIQKDFFLFCEESCGDEDHVICNMIRMKQKFNHLFPSQKERVSDDKYNDRIQFVYDHAYPKPYPTILSDLESHDEIEEFVISETIRFETYVGMTYWEAFVNSVVNLIRLGFLEWNGPCLRVSKQGANEIVTRICTGEIEVPLLKELEKKAENEVAG